MAASSSKRDQGRKPVGERKRSRSNAYAREKRIERMWKLTARERMRLALELGRFRGRGAHGR